jgi:hypothetical protein
VDKIGLIVGIVLSLVGLYKIDSFLYPTLDYFGKYVFFTLMNIFSIWLVYLFFKSFNGFLKILMPTLMGGVVLLVGVKIV